MIGFDDLCEALERYNRRRRNQAEMAELEQSPGPIATTPTVQDPEDAEALGFHDADAISLEEIDSDVRPLDGEPTQLSSMDHLPGDRRD